MRLAAGKPAEGMVRLTAAHRSGRIVIEVSDDGAGIDRPKVRASAIKKGLIAADAQLSDNDIDNLLFLPGFSTAATVSSISGRGVGMDVVKRSIVALGGRISISSRPGLGSTFSMSLPLTLAVLDGMAVSVAGQTLVVPLTAIVETSKPKKGEIHALGADGRVMSIRNTFVPVIDVGTQLGFRDVAMEPERGVAILVETGDGTRNALLVDSIQDQRQVVIKSLEANYGTVAGIAAATILGDGRVALILDVDALVSGSLERSARRRAALWNGRIAIVHDIGHVSQFWRSGIRCLLHGVAGILRRHHGRSRNSRLDAAPRRCRTRPPTFAASSIFGAPFFRSSISRCASASGSPSRRRVASSSSCRFISRSSVFSSTPCPTS